MKVAIASMGVDVNSPVAYQFGRAPYYIIYDSNSDTVESLPNTYAIAAGGAGIQAVQMLVSRGVNLVLMGGVVGPNASMVLDAAGVPVIPNVSGNVNEAIEAVKSGRYSTVQSYTAPYPVPVSPPVQFTSAEDELKYIEDRIKYIEKRLKDVEKQLKGV